MKAGLICCEKKKMPKTPNHEGHEEKPEKRGVRRQKPGDKKKYNVLSD